MRWSERLYRLALRSYPASYRSTHGEVMLGTLLELSVDRPRWVLADVMDLVVHGLQQRLGLTTESAAGDALAMAALPGLVMAATFSLCAFALGDEVDAAGVAWPHMGPFATVGPAVYLVWLAVAAMALWRPRWQRALAVIGVATALTAIPIGQAFFALPPKMVLLLPVGLAVPAALAPSRGARASSRAPVICAAGTAALVLVADVWWSNNTTLFSPTRWHYLGFTWFYFGGLLQLADVMAYVGLVVVLAIGWLLHHRRRAIAGALAALIVPWLLAGALGARGVTTGATITSTASMVDAVLAGVAGVVGLAIWLRGLRGLRGLRDGRGVEETLERA